MKPLGAILAALAAGTALAQQAGAPPSNWTSLHLDTGGCSQFLDYSTVAWHGAYASARLLKSCSQPRHVLEEAGSPMYSSEVTLLYFDCTNQEVMAAEGSKYAGRNGSGDVVESFQEPITADEFTKVVSGTAGEVWLQRACEAAARARR